MLVCEIDKFTHLLEDLLKTEMYVKLSLLGEICGDIKQILCHLNISFFGKFRFCCEFYVNKEVLPLPEAFHIWSPTEYPLIT